MSNEMKDWYNERKDEAFDAICKIAEIYEDCYVRDTVLEKIGNILRDYEFID